MIPNRWYPILETSKLGRKPIGVKRLGRRLVLWRDGAGRAVALPSTCPHRGAALEQGRVTNGELACPWHGFRFAADGACTRMPCEGAETKPPQAMGLEPALLSEQHGLIWLWHGEARQTLPPVQFFDDEVGDDLQTSSEASYVLPYHYSRMVETNLDLHHSPFVHRGFFPNKPRVDPFEAHIEGDRISTSGTMRREGAEAGFDFRVDCLLPNLGYLRLGEKLHIVIAATPVDDENTWVWFRYYQGYTRIRPIGRLISWVAVQSELLVVQRQDWRIFRELPKGSIDDVPYHFVRADQGIALYRKRRRELVDEEAAEPVREAV